MKDYKIMMTHTRPNQTPHFSVVAKVAVSNLGIFLYSCCQGIGGIIVLLFSAAMLYSPTILPLALPLIAGFNSAVAGYVLLERKEQTLSSQKYLLAAISVILSCSGSLLLVFFCPWESLLDPVNHIHSVIVSLPLAFLGGWIGVKSHLTRPSTPLK